ncbi:MAG: PilT protein domain protein [Prosthecobacter sp.]|nr:PilT protein domain protein [Prosthecobacter sp.]
MVVLDTNHLSALERAGASGVRLRDRLRDRPQELFTTVISVEEQLHGRMGTIAQLSRQPHQQIEAYQRFYERVEYYARWSVLLWDQESANLFEFHRKNGLRIGTMDLKIACIAITHDALLLTQNSVDFAKVPTLRFENWLVE